MIQQIFKSQKAFFSTGRTKPLAFRIEQLKKLQAAIRKNENAILNALHEDMRKPKFEAYGAEVGLVLDELRHSIKGLPGWMKPKRVPTPLPHFVSTSRIYNEPVGTVLVVAPWNYPFQLTVAPLVAAIAAGNTTVLKPSELAPATSAAMTKMIRETFEPEYIACFEGGADVTQKILEQPFDHFFFTGGEKVGRIVMEAAAKHLAPVTLELGGKSPCIVDKGYPLQQAAQRIVWGKFFNAGQTCVAPDYLLVHASVKDAMIGHLKTTLQQFFGDNPKSSPDYARVVNDRHFDRLVSLLKNGKAVAGGDSDRSQRYIAPTILTDVKLSDPIMQEEIFGPILPVLTYQTIDEAIQIVHERPKPLALYVFSTSSAVQERVLNEISFGGGCINDTLVHLSSVHLPFGGTGPSGMGSYHGKTGFDVFSHRKSILKKTALFDVPLRYAPYSEGKFSLLRKLFR